MTFAADKNTIQSGGIVEESLTVYQLLKDGFRECQVERTVQEDLLYIKVKAEELGYFALGGLPLLFSWKLISTFTTAIAVAATFAVCFIERRRIIRALKGLWKDFHGKRQ